MTQEEIKKLEGEAQESFDKEVKYGCKKEIKKSLEFIKHAETKLRDAKEHHKHILKLIEHDPVSVANRNRE